MIGDPIAENLGTVNVLLEEEGKQPYLREDETESDEHPKLSSENRQPPIEKLSYVPIGILYGFYYIVFTVVIPALPALTLRLADDDSSQAAYLYGLANFVRYIVEFFAAPVLGNLTDIYGRKVMLCISFAICGIEYALLAFFPSISMIFISRAMSGAFDSALPTSYTIVTDLALYNKDTMTTKYGLLGAVSGLGYIVGPLLGGVLSDISLPLCFIVASGFAFFGLVLTVILLPETVDINKPHTTSSADPITSTTSSATPTKPKLKDWNPFPALKIHFRNQELRELSIPLVLSALNLGLGAIWYIYMAYRYDASSTAIGVYLSFFGVVSAVYQGILIKRIVPKYWSEQNACVFGFYMLAIQYVAYGVSPWQWGLYLAVLLFTFGMVSDSALKSLIVQSSTRQRLLQSFEKDTMQLQGNLQGVLCSIRTLGNAFGSLIFASVYGYCIGLTPSMPYVAFCFGGMLYAIAGGYSQWLFRSQQQRDGSSSKKASSSEDHRSYMKIDMEEPLYQPIE